MNYWVKVNNFENCEFLASFYFLIVFHKANPFLQSPVWVRKWMAFTLHKNWSFPLRMSSVNVTKSFMVNFIFCAVLRKICKYFQKTIRPLLHFPEPTRLQIFLPVSFQSLFLFGKGTILNVWRVSVYASLSNCIS